MKTRTILYADEGKILTNGKIYGRQILLQSGDSGFSFYEIDEAEYEQKLEEENKKEYFSE
mgnify:CR=1 FL=1